jgi:hypothetical protein
MATGGGRLSDAGGSTISLEMGYSMDEFIRVLPLAMRDWPVTGGPDAWQVRDTAGELLARVHIKPGSERAMGALRLPVLAVTIDLGDAGDTLACEFMRRFERGFHRGGG